MHGNAVVEANRRLLHNVRRIANVKIIGPLQRNLALINISPLPPKDFCASFVKEISGLENIEKAYLVERPMRLTIRANPGQYH